ncbi:hypothetical protein QJU58_00535 [Pasteurella atlantica]|uniref:Uncharacterized protein n=1 Tax=Pasteurella atlantica TaxID=2827233 RepID=A0AAW8CCV6_9PAST|nr:hypothetical protein [Pasteurella atlantica]MDP8038608.1 hypothetical protein [Pasteurella atlantica]MDP8040700.1 hypothetical protein [Pasteurella atlantica]MDP8042835.1 hypothetical protein [Pasteurella atlantica]MDP8044922.1 hypothetical protein [Pasteurella atlantica]MDP8121778.1 hypothetical protein [Pasteurella atlantica]
MLALIDRDSKSELSKLQDFGINQVLRKMRTKMMVVQSF